MFLTNEQLKKLTGYETPAGFARWLDARGWRYERNRRGEVVLLTSYMEAMMGNAPARVAGPKFEAIGGR